MFPLKESQSEKMEHDHVEHMMGGGAVCKHCGGEVDEDGAAKGYSDGGEIESDVTEAADEDEGSESKQHQTDVQLRNEGGFAAALKRRMR